MSNRLDQEKENELQPERMEYAIQELKKLGVFIEYRDKTKVLFQFKEHRVAFFPYSGWHTGKSIKDGRGLKNLLSQLKNK